MADFKYKVSVVIPVYNCAEYLETCLESLDNQTMDKDDYQIVLVNDGSTDCSEDVCENLAWARSNVTYFSKENGGVSSARNKGMELSEGKYILFLDADDHLSEETLLTVYEFFEEHYDETDLVTYKIIPYFKGKKFKMHYRFRFLKETGVYDLTDPEYCYVTQTTMNICVKNEGDNNVLFDTDLKYHEDQKYCFEILKRKMTIGYCADAKYWYLRHPNSATGQNSYAYYIFEDTMQMWESMFAEYEKVPAYLQSLYLNDLNWKGLKDILLPYHYSEQGMNGAVARIVELLKKVDDEVIINYPAMDVFHKHFLIKLKGSKAVRFECDENGIKLLMPGSDGEEICIYNAKRLTAIVNGFTVKGDTVSVDAFLKSPALMYCEKPELYLIADGKRTKLELTHSAFEYYHARIKNSVFWRVRFDVDASLVKKFELEAVFDGVPVKVIYYHQNHIPFRRDKKRKTFYRGSRFYKESNGKIRIKSGKIRNSLMFKVFEWIFDIFFCLKNNKRVLYNRMFAHVSKLNKKRVWIYLDRYGVFDNAYDQFKHDIKINDGVERYYVLNECDWDKLEEKFEPQEHKSVIKFASRDHKKYYFTCEKLITSFSNSSNICPFGTAAMRWYADLAEFELIYLQHGILHASLKHMYAKERCLVDRVVVSSGFEVENFTQNYGYAEKDLIKAGMPRYDFMRSETVKKNRIVFSPSWRSNLIGELKNNSRAEKRNEFIKSEFYREVSAVLNSERLHGLLEDYDLYLDFRNHPIFKCYNDLFSSTSNRICFGDFETEMDEYKLMITDYSSIVFDSVYTNCPIIYFVPDYDKFKAGISHGYRKLDLPLEEGFGPLTFEADALIDELEKIIKNGFVPAEPYKSRMDGFFLYKDNNCRSRIYQDIK